MQHKFRLLSSSFFIIFFSLIPLLSVHAKDPVDGVISGIVQDLVSKETLIGATVSVKGTKFGAYTNKSGFFSIPSLQPGDYTIRISSIGYEAKEMKVTVPANGSLSLRIDMTVGNLTTEAVTVDADRDEEKKQINISRVNIPMQQLNQIRIGGEADIFRALQMLPGVLTSSQISSGLYIRGGSPDQNLVLLDGMTVYNPTHLFGFISAFNNDAIKDVELLKGGFPAEYGGRMSAVLNVTQKDGNQDHVEGLVGVGLISSRVSVQGPLGNGSWFIGGRRTYLDLLLGLLPEDPKSPFPSFNFYDVNAKITQNFGSDDKVSISGFLTSDNLGLQQPGLLFNIGIGNQAASARWSHIFSPNLFSVFTTSASTYTNGFNGNNSGFLFDIQNVITDYSWKGEFEWFVTDELTVKSGFEGNVYNFTYSQSTGSSEPSTGAQNNEFYLNIWDNLHSAFGQINYLATKQLSLQAGIRGNYYSKRDVITVDPRLALRFQVTDEIAIKGAWGIFHQYLRLASAPDFSFFDTWLPTDNTVPVGRSDHFIFAIETKPFEDFNFNVDLYYKNLYNINELRQNQTRATTVGEVFYIGNGTAYGAEFFLQKKMGQLTGWVGYGLGWVNAVFDSVNRGVEFRPKYDRRHDFKVNLLYQFNERWEFGASFIFQSGQSYTGATSQFSGRMPGWEGGVVMVNPSQRWGLRLPNSHQLNLNINYNTTLFDLPFRIFLDVYNVYNRRDIWFRYYDTTSPTPTVTDVLLLPILPTISAELKF